MCWVLYFAVTVIWSDIHRIFMILANPTITWVDGHSASNNMNIQWKQKGASWSQAVQIWKLQMQLLAVAGSDGRLGAGTWVLLPLFTLDVLTLPVQPFLFYVVVKDDDQCLWWRADINRAALSVVCSREELCAWCNISASLVMGWH